MGSSSFVAYNYSYSLTTNIESFPSLFHPLLQEQVTPQSVPVKWLGDAFHSVQDLWRWERERERCIALPVLRSLGAFKSEGDKSRGRIFRVECPGFTFSYLVPLTKYARVAMRWTFLKVVE